jgi:NAD+ synthase (glutamine-hydrolysing)
MHHFDDIRHDPEKTDVVYENAQARERTQILMDLANQENGLVIGTGDLSEIALGWCTFNGDHMSMYSVNGTLPKTLMRAIVEEIASQTPGKVAKCLRDINDTPVSPELLPDAQHTEKIIGDYTLHDFFLYYFIRYGETPENLRRMAESLFADTYPAEEIGRTLSLFMRRFFTQQFKRNTMPEGPDTGEISLSPRGGWEMPADADSALWTR